MEERTPAYKVMIAEDELLVRVGLNLTVPWEDYGMQVVAVVEDGVSAWEAYQIHRPNIVLTDLCMPGMDGVELVRKIRESGEVCEIIIITCIEDFDTLYQLMKMGITGYLVKATMVQKDIDEVLKKALNNLKDIYVSVAYTTSLPGDMRKANPLYDFVFFHHDSDLYLSECEKHEQYYKHIQYCILILWDSQVRSILKSSITSIFQKRLNPFRVSDVYFDDELLFISLAHTDEHDINEIYLVIRELLSYIDEVLDVKLRIVICETKGSDERLAKLVSKGQIILRNSYFYPSSLTVLQADRPGERGTFDLHDCITLLQERILVMVPLMNYQKNKLLFSSNIDALKESLGISREKYEKSLLSLAELYLITINKTEKSDDLLNHLRISLAEAESAKDAFMLFETIVFGDSSCLHPIYCKEMLNTICYIRENIDQNISLTDMASMVCVSPNYYSVLFKQMVGCSFSDYLGLVRIDKACELIGLGEFSIQKVSTLCGFSDASYFSRFFKQKTGLSPHQLRVAK